LYRKSGILLGLVIAAVLASSAAGAAPDAATGISAAQLTELLEAGGDVPLVLDVRGLEAHREGTIPGALHVGMDPAAYLPTVSERIVVLVLPEPYTAAYLGAWVRRLGNAGYLVRRLEGGMPAWRAAGLPVSTPEHVYSRPGTVPFVVPRGLCEMEEPAQEFR